MFGAKKSDIASLTNHHLQFHLHVHLATEELSNVNEANEIMAFITTLCALTFHICWSSSPLFWVKVPHTSRVTIVTYRNKWREGK